MKHPQHKAMGFEQKQELLWITIFTQLPGIGFESNKYTSSRGRGLNFPKKAQRHVLALELLRLSM